MDACFPVALNRHIFCRLMFFKNIVKTKLNVSFSNSMNVLETAFDFFS